MAKTAGSRPCLQSSLEGTETMGRITGRLVVSCFKTDVPLVVFGKVDGLDA